MNQLFTRILLYNYIYSLSVLLAEYESVKIMVKYTNVKKLFCKFSAASRQGDKLMRDASRKEVLAEQWGQCRGAPGLGL